MKRKVIIWIVVIVLIVGIVIMMAMKRRKLDFKRRIKVINNTPNEATITIDGKSNVIKKGMGIANALGGDYTIEYDGKAISIKKDGIIRDNIILPPR